MFKIFDGRDSFYQWDINQKLIVGEPTVKEVHFANAARDYALPVETYTQDGLLLVDVPNEMLTEELPLKVYGFCGECTKISAIFKVLERAKPEDYIYTEPERRTWETLEKRIEEVNKDLTKEIEEANKELAEDIATVETNLNKTKLDKKEANKLYSNILTGTQTVIGKQTSIKGYIPDSTIDINVTPQKNHIKHPYSGSKGEYGTVKFTESTTNPLTVSVTGTNDNTKQAFYHFAIFREKNLTLEPNTTYTISSGCSKENEDVCYLKVEFEDSNGAREEYSPIVKSGKSEYKFTTPNKYLTIYRISIVVEKGASITGTMSFTPKLIKMPKTVTVSAYANLSGTPITYKLDSNGSVKDVRTYMGTTWITAEEEESRIYCDYYKNLAVVINDIHKAIKELGGNI